MTTNICSNRRQRIIKWYLKYIFESRRCIGKNATKYWIEILLPPAKNQNPFIDKTASSSPGQDMPSSWDILQHTPKRGSLQASAHRKSEEALTGNDVSRRVPESSASGKATLCWVSPNGTWKKGQYIFLKYNIIIYMVFCTTISIPLPL